MAARARRRDAVGVERVDKHRPGDRGPVLNAYGPYPSKVERVVDGDTIDLVVDLGFNLFIRQRVRLYGLNAPELRTEAGKASKANLEKVAPRDTVAELVSLGFDKFGGRVDGRIRTAAGDLGELQLAGGFAKTWDGHGARPS